MFSIRAAAPFQALCRNMMVSSETLLSLQNLSIGPRTADASHSIVRNVGLTVARGEVVGVVGESGSGKSLTALAISGMLPAALKITSGNIILNDAEITGLKEAEFHRIRGREIGYVFQDPLNALNPTRTIGNHLIDVLKRRGDVSGRTAKHEAIEALRSVGISRPEDRLPSYPHQLSGGMRQRVLIAMALACRPKLLIADEPTTALDVTVQATIIDLFRGIREQGIAILFISHNLDLILEFCDTVVVMYGGRLMEKASAREISSGSRHPYTRALMECVPRLTDAAGELQVIPGQPPLALGNIDGCPFAERCNRALDICSSVFPELVPNSPTHAVACWNPIAVTETTT
jgi:oligopeptide/dipeptide ABC transporter ATP-binding protein